ncbi:SPOR domain-containing protein [Pelotalea chapellei]|uniref:SPOR domain-containing protein n=1 Tax=Pelotalea chapellei TaxID=44671 RepID=A0ABS5U6B9_9BACT|nr:SPOR domain-containing protein [Pelotalea chapellei]MBT1071207.1 SPOR domain-containing protein [Pelotalea chapellei]
MRIDYSEPKQSYVAGQNKPRPRKESVALMTTVVIVTGIIMFIAGFGTGWFFSHRAAIKSFQAATSQTSLENSPKQVAEKPTLVPQPQTPVPPQKTAADTSTSAPQTAPQPPPEPALSFYKTLPSGQKNTALGSGINSETKTKQPLQAAIPSNVARQSAVESSQSTADRPAPPSPDKPAAKLTDTKYTVQLASFSLRSEAEVLKNKLAGKGYNAFINESNQGDKGIWYRVRVGKKLESEAAKELAGKLGKGAIVIPD